MCIFLIKMIVAHLKGIAIIHFIVRLSSTCSDIDIIYFTTIDLVLQNGGIFTMIVVMEMLRYCKLYNL